MIRIQLKNITKHYGPSSEPPAVDNVSLTVEPGELFFLLGPSGCGKTTLLRIIAGLLESSAGRVHFDDRDVTDLPIERRNTAMVFQNYALWPHMTVTQNVEFAPKMQGMAGDQRRELAGRQLDRVEMGGYERRKPTQLSGGQQQRVALARALAAQADCLLLDEPLSNLDAKLRATMRSQLRELVKASGTTGVYVTHDQKEAMSMADRMAVMHKGKLVQVGRPEEVYSRPATRFVAEFMGEANFLSAKVVQPGKAGRVQTELGELPAELPADVTTGQAITCCLRPERIAILPADAAPPSTDELDMPAEVESSVYLGDLRQYTCRLGEGLHWRVSALAGAHRLSGAVRLRLNPKEMAVVTQ